MRLMVLPLITSREKGDGKEFFFGGRRGIDYKYRCAALRVDGVLSLLDLPVPSLADPQKHLGLRELISVGYWNLPLKLVLRGMRQDFGS